MRVIHLYTVTLKGIKKPIQWKGFYLISYLCDEYGEKTVSISVGDKVIILGMEVTIMEIRDQHTCDFIMQETALGWKHWMRFNRDLGLDCHQEKN